MSGDQDVWATTSAVVMTLKAIGAGDEPVKGPKR